MVDGELIPHSLFPEKLSLNIIVNVVNKYHVHYYRNTNNMKHFDRLMIIYIIYVSTVLHWLFARDAE